jgi:antitoxin component of MazEF toxin-antitoxin module
MMQTLELKITKIGNSQGIRIPAGVLRRYAFKDVLVMIEGVDGVLLRPKLQTDVKMSWTETAKAMAESSEDWSDWENVSADGLSAVPWAVESTAGKRDKKPQRRRHETI